MHLLRGILGGRDCSPWLRLGFLYFSRRKTCTHTPFNTLKQREKSQKHDFTPLSKKGKHRLLKALNANINTVPMC